MSPPLPEEDQQPLAEHKPPQQLGNASVPPATLTQAGLTQHQLTVLATRKEKPITDQIIANSQIRHDMLSSSSLEGCAQVLVEQPTLEAMLKRLEEFEVTLSESLLCHISALLFVPVFQLEEDQIRQKWVSVAFESLPSRTTMHCEGKPISLYTAFESLSCTLPPLPIGQGDLSHPTPLPLPLPPSLLSSIHQYQDRYTHYLQLTGVNPRVDFDPWKTVERYNYALYLAYIHKAFSVYSYCG